MTTSTFSAVLPQKPNSWRSKETLTQSTATTVQSLSLQTEISILGMGTATGFARNRYELASGAVEGQEKLVIAEATGEAYLRVSAQSGRIPMQIAFASLPTATNSDSLYVTSTGDWVFQSAEDYILLKYISGVWTYIALVGATYATAS